MRSLVRALVLVAACVCDRPAETPDAGWGVAVARGARVAWRAQSQSTHECCRLDPINPDTIPYFGTDVIYV